MNYPLKYLLAIAIGSVVTGVAYAVIKQRLVHVGSLGAKV
jgi:PTS system fructose-specific IIC component